MCHISRKKSGTTPGGMKTISFQQVRSAPKTNPVVYKTDVILRAPLRHPAIEWQQSTMNLIALVSRERARAYYSVWHRICKFTHLFNIIFRDLRLAKYNKQQIQIKLRWALFVTYTIIQSIMRSKMCSLHLTHPSGTVGSRHCSAQGAVWGLVPCSRDSPQSWTLPAGAGIRTHNLGFQVQRSNH